MEPATHLDTLADARRTLEALAAAGPDWLAERRGEAWQAHASLPLPDRAQHRWRYTDPAKLLPGERVLLPAPVFEDALGAGETVGADVATTGGLIALSEEARRAGVVLGSLAELAVRRPETIRALLGRIVPASETPFTALNAALWNEGLYLEIPPGLHVPHFVHLVRRFPASGLALPRLLVLLREGAQATIVDESLGENGDSGDLLVHRTIEIALERGASLRWIGVQDLPAGTTGASVLRAHLEAEAALVTQLASFGGALVKADVAAEMEGRGAHSEVQGLVFGVGRQAFDLHTIQRHDGPDTTSNLSVRVALRGRARSAFTGMLSIAHDAVRSQAYQENRNLLLSKTANAVSIPELEILTDEVQASHGATVGPIDEEQLHYLQTRGLRRTEAESMIVAGFFEPLLAKIPDEILREQLRQRIEARLEH